MNHHIFSMNIFEQCIYVFALYASLCIISKSWETNQIPKCMDNVYAINIYVSYLSKFRSSWPLNFSHYCRALPNSPEGYQPRCLFWWLLWWKLQWPMNHCADDRSCVPWVGHAIDVDPAMDTDHSRRYSLGHWPFFFFFWLLLSCRLVSYENEWRSAKNKRA